MELLLDTVNSVLSITMKTTPNETSFLISELLVAVLGSQRFPPEYKTAALQARELV